MTNKKWDIVDYRKLRPGNLNSDRFRHLFYLLFWPAFVLVFFFIEQVGVTGHYHLMHCALDDSIPFCKYFIFPYMFWFLFVFGMHIYTLLFDLDTFKKFIRYIIITYGVTLLIYIAFPTAQNLRPASFAQDDALTRFITSFYAFDTNTNVCPSLHVIGSLAVMFAAWHSKHFNALGWKIAFALTAVTISLSTVFLKQHSALDILASLPICLGAYPLVYKWKPRRRQKNREKDLQRMN